MVSLLKSIKKSILGLIKQEYQLSDKQITSIQITLNVDKSKDFGDLNCNAAMVLAKQLDQPSQTIAQQIKKIIDYEKELVHHIRLVESVGPGFINIHFHTHTWHTIAKELFFHPKASHKPEPTEPRKNYLIEFVSANPTGPLHLGHGRNGIIGDVLANILKFLGHKADREFYINDSGSQIEKLGRSFKIRCQQEFGYNIPFPDDGYAGEYLVELARQCIEHFGKNVLKKEDTFFQDYAKDQLLEQIKQTLDTYGITFDRWFSERQLHKSDAINKVIELLQEKNLVYEKDGATWFNSTSFGDDKDRVIRKYDGTLTYIAADIAYHKDKFDRGYDILIDVLGQDHHGYVTRLKATMQALGYKKNRLDVILYQLVSIKASGKLIRMSKRAGTFEKLSDIIEEIGTDVARFFYLNRKADAHLDFDLDIALKKTEENPVYYIQYAYVRTNSLFSKAAQEKQLLTFANTLQTKSIDEKIITDATTTIETDEVELIKKIHSLGPLLNTIASNYQTHLLSYYTLELARIFHKYYAENKIIDIENIQTSKSRLLLTKLIQQTLGLCLDLLGVSKPEKM